MSARLWPLVRARPGLFALAALLSVAYSSLPLLTGLILRAFLDALGGGAPVQFRGEEVEVGMLVWAFLGATLAAQLSTQVYAATNVYFYGALGALLRRNWVQGMLEGRGRRRQESTGEIIDRFDSDVDAVVEPVWELVGLPGHLISAALALGVLLSIDPLITGVAFLPILAVLALMKWLGQRLQGYRERSRAASGRASGFLGELVAGVQAVKLAGTEEQATERLGALSQARGRAELKDRLFDQALRSASDTANHLAIGAMLVVAAQAMRAGAFTVGDLALFISYISPGESALLGLVGWVGRLLAEHRQARVSAGRLEEILPEGARQRLARRGPVYLRGELPVLPGLRKTGTGRLEGVQVRGLSCRYPGGRGIEQIDLELRRGSFAVVTGRVGAGKSTLLRAMLGLLPDTSGEVRWNGERVEEPGEFMRPPRCAYVAQVPGLFSDTLRENILLGLGEGEVDLPAALQAAVLEEDVERLGEGLDTLVGPRGVRLSGGQVQRTALARALVRQPELLLVDDLSSALDVETEERLWAGLLGRPGATILAVSHRRAVLRRADWIAVLKEGRVQSRGRLEELLATCAEMQALWREEGE